MQATFPDWPGCPTPYGPHEIQRIRPGWPIPPFVVPYFIGLNVGRDDFGQVSALIFVIK